MSLFLKFVFKLLILISGATYVTHVHICLLINSNNGFFNSENILTILLLNKHPLLN